MNVHLGQQYYVTITTNITVIMRYKGVYAAAQLRPRAFSTCLHTARPSPGTQNPPPSHELCSRKPTPDIDESHQMCRLPCVTILPNIMLFSRQRTATMTSGLTRNQARERVVGGMIFQPQNSKCAVRRALYHHNSHGENECSASVVTWQTIVTPPLHRLAVVQRKPDPVHRSIYLFAR